jgi:hypothetical protein
LVALRQRPRQISLNLIQRIRGPRPQAPIGNGFPQPDPAPQFYGRARSTRPVPFPLSLMVQAPNPSSNASTNSGMRKVDDAGLNGEEQNPFDAEDVKMAVI